MKFSAPDWCFYSKEMAPADYYAKLKACGYSAVEMVDETRWAEARKAGLDLVNMTGIGMQRGLNRKEHHGVLLPKIRDLIHTAAHNGIPQVVLFSGNREGHAVEQGLQNCIQGIQQLIGLAEELGITLLFEILNGHNHPDYQADHSAFGFSLVKAIGSEHLKVLFDIYHMFRMGEDVRTAIQGHIHDIGFIHIAGHPKRNFPGSDQDIDYRELVPAIMEAGYSGYWGMEFKPGTDPFGELESAARLFESYAERVPY